MRFLFFHLTKMRFLKNFIIWMRFLKNFIVWMRFFQVHITNAQENRLSVFINLQEKPEINIC